MNKKLIFPVVVVIAIIAVLGMTQLPQLGIAGGWTYDFETHTMDGTASTYELWSDSPTEDGVQYWGPDGAQHRQYGEEVMELLDHERYIMSWQGEASDSITLRGQAYRPGLFHTWVGTEHNPYFTDYYWLVEVYNKVTSTWDVLTDGDHGIIDQSLLTDETGDKMGWQDWEFVWCDGCNMQAILSVDTLPHSDYGIGYRDCPWNILWSGSGMATDNAICRLESEPATIRFLQSPQKYIDTPIRVSQYCITTWHDGTIGGFKYYTSPLTTVYDSAELVSGGGFINIDASGNNNPRTFEEKQTLTMRVQTGWTSLNENDENWEIRIYSPDGALAIGRNIVIKDSSGVVVNGDYSPTFRVKNNLYNAVFTWYLAEGTVKDGDGVGGYGWHFQLLNTITAKDEKFVFVVREGEANCGPVGTAITDFEKSSFESYLRVEAYGNQVCDGFVGDVGYFVIRCYKDNLLYRTYNWQAHTVVGVDNKWAADGTISTELHQEALKVEVTAHDSDDFPGAGASNVWWFGDENMGQLTVYVTYQNSPCSGASVSIDGISQTANTYGVASFTLPLDTSYTAVVNCDGTEKIVQFTMYKDGQELRIDLGLNLVNIIIVAVIAITAILLALLIPVSPAVKIIIAVLGLILALIIYLFLEGFLTLTGF